MLLWRSATTFDDRIRMTIDQRRRKIVNLLRAGDAQQMELAEHLDRCRLGLCNRCGDLCPAKAGNWADGNVTKILDLLTIRGSEPLLNLRYTREVWNRESGKLVDPASSSAGRGGNDNKSDLVGISGVARTVKRALDKLADPQVTAFGMVDAWYGYDSWKVGVSLIVAGTTTSALRDQFPAGEMAIESVVDGRQSVRRLLTQSRQAKQWPPFDAAREMPFVRQREYLVWLANTKWSGRLFRYGCDRSFNWRPRTKKVQPMEQKKARPYPYWLQSFMFGNHPINCQCRACDGLGKFHRRG